MQLHKFHPVLAAHGYWDRQPPAFHTAMCRGVYARPCVTYSAYHLSDLQLRVGKMLGRIGDDTMAWDVEHEERKAAAGGSKLCVDIYTQTEA